MTSNAADARRDVCYEPDDRPPLLISCDLDSPSDSNGLAVARTEHEPVCGLADIAGRMLEAGVAADDADRLSSGWKGGQ